MAKSVLEILTSLSIFYPRHEWDHLHCGPRSGDVTGIAQCTSSKVPNVPKEIVEFVIRGNGIQQGTYMPLEFSESVKFGFSNHSIKSRL